MSLSIASAGAFVSRTTGTMISTASNFTVMLWSRGYSGLPNPGLFRTYWEVINSGNGKYFGFYQGSNGNYELYAANGIDPDNWLDVPGTYDQDVHFCITYVASTKTFSFYVNALFVGSFILDMSTAVFIQENISTDASWSNTQAAFVRVWQRALSLAEIQSYRNSSSPVNTTNIIGDWPMASDYNDISGLGNNYTTTTGSVSFIASHIYTDIRFSMGASLRTSPVCMPNTGSAGVLGLPFLEAWLYPTTSLFQLGLKFASATDNGVPYPNATTTGVDFNVILDYRIISNGHTTQTFNQPFADPMIGFQVDIPGSNPRVNWAWHQWTVTYKSSSYDIVSHTFLTDGAIEVKMDSTVLYNGTGLNLAIQTTRPELVTQFYPCGDMDACWVTNQNVLPTYSGAQNVPSSYNLQQYFNFNDQVRPPAGYSVTNILGFTPVALDGTAINGLSATPGISINTLDVTTTHVLTGGNSYCAMASGLIELGNNILDSGGGGATGTIVVAKVTNPVDGSHSFGIVTNLPIGAFSLLNEGSQVFTGLNAGSIWSFIENADPDWFPTYMVSNDAINNDNTAVVVEANKSITVLILNARSTDGGGLYFYPLLGNPLSGNPPAVPGTGKTNDDFANQDGTVVTRKIPNPFYITGFVGDK